MAKPCTFETYFPNGDPDWCCTEKSTMKVSMDVVNDANEYWQEIVETNSSCDKDLTRLWVVYEDLCDVHGKLAQEVYNNLKKAEEVKDEVHVQVDQT